MLTVTQVGDVLNIIGDTDYLNQSDVIEIVRNSVNPDFLDVRLNGFLFLPFFGVNQINILGQGGNDAVTLDSSNGLIDVVRGTFYDGGGGFDRLNLLQTGGPTHIVDSYSVGPNNGRAPALLRAPAIRKPCTSRTSSRCSTSCPPPR